MVRATLDDLPSYPLPDGYVLRMYRPGDEHAWVTSISKPIAGTRDARDVLEGFGIDPAR